MIEIAVLLLENVDNDIAVVQNHPKVVFHSLHTGRFEAELFARFLYDIVCNRCKASRLSFVVPEPVKVITLGMVVLNSSANKVTCEVLFVRMIGVRPESTTLQISFTMRSFRTVSSESDWYIAVMVCLSSVIDRYDVNLGIRYLSKDCLAI